MSIHCLICGHQDNWLPEGECEVNDYTWVVLKVFPDYLLNRPRKRMIEEWWVHSYCMKQWLKERTEAESKIKVKLKRVKS